MNILWGGSVDEATTLILLDAYRNVIRKVRSDRDLCGLVGGTFEESIKKRLLNMARGGERDSDVLALEAVAHLRQIEQIRRSSMRNWKSPQARNGVKLAS